MINRYECVECGWYADIQDDPDQGPVYFSTTRCDKCGGKLRKLGAM